MPPKRSREKTPTYTPLTPPQRSHNFENPPSYSTFLAPSSTISVNQGIYEETLKTITDTLGKLELSIDAIHRRIDSLNVKTVENFEKTFKHVDDRCEKLFNEIDTTHEDVKNMNIEVLNIDEKLDEMKKVLGVVEDRIEIFCDEHEAK